MPAGANELSLALAIVSLLRDLGGWGLWPLVILLFLTPPLVGLIGVTMGVRSVRSLERAILASQHQIQDAIKSFEVKYDRNIEFVHETQKLVRSYQASLDTMLQVVRDNTQALTQVVERIKGMRHE